MSGPRIGESNLGAAAGAAVGAIGGLFAIGLVPAIYYRDLSALIATPMLNLICFCLCGTVGWLAGGQIGPRLGMRLSWSRAEIAGGVAGGLLPVALVAYWGWRMSS